MANKENVQVWVDALRSGEYSQTKGLLQRTKQATIGGESIPPGHCCLGVACEISEVDLHKKMVDDWDHAYFDGEDEFLPEKVSRWLGFRTYKPHVRMPNGSWKSLIELNDEGMSFQDIADLIQKTYL